MNNSLVLTFLILFFKAFAAYADSTAEVINEINIARMDPDKYVEFLQEWKSRYFGRNVKLSETLFLRTQEDNKSVDEAIEYMKNRKPIEPLVYSEELSMAARRMVIVQGAASQTGHVSPDGLGIADRARLYGRWITVIGENIAYGLNEPRQIVMMWIIDDGVPRRSHRNNLFRRDFKVVGAALGPHADWRVMCVVDFAGGFLPLHPLREPPPGHP
jgi:uncharacterized protein YkwD